MPVYDSELAHTRAYRNECASSRPDAKDILHAQTLQNRGVGARYLRLSLILLQFMILHVSFNNGADVSILYPHTDHAVTHVKTMRQHPSTGQHPSPGQHPSKGHVHAEHYMSFALARYKREDRQPLQREKIKQDWQPLQREEFTQDLKRLQREQLRQDLKPLQREEIRQALKRLEREMIIQDLKPLQREGVIQDLKRLRLEENKGVGRLTLKDREKEKEKEASRTTKRDESDPTSTTRTLGLLSYKTATQTTQLSGPTITSELNSQTRPIVSSEKDTLPLTSWTSVKKASQTTIQDENGPTNATRTLDPLSYKTATQMNKLSGPTIASELNSQTQPIVSNKKDTPPLTSWTSVAPQRMLENVLTSQHSLSELSSPKQAIRISRLSPMAMRNSVILKLTGPNVLDDKASGAFYSALLRTLLQRQQDQDMVSTSEEVLPGSGQKAQKRPSLNDIEYVAVHKGLHILIRAAVKDPNLVQQSYLSPNKLQLPKDGVLLRITIADRNQEGAKSTSPLSNKRLLIIVVAIIGCLLLLLVIGLAIFKRKGKSTGDYQSKSPVYARHAPSILSAASSITEIPTAGEIPAALAVDGLYSASAISGDSSEIDFEMTWLKHTPDACSAQTVDPEC